MFSIPRTSIRNHFSASGRSSGQDEALGDLGVEPELVDLVVTREAVPQKREELRHPTLQVALVDRATPNRSRVRAARCKGAASAAKASSAAIPSSGGLIGGMPSTEVG